MLSTKYYLVLLALIVLKNCVELRKTNNAKNQTNPKSISHEQKPKHEPEPKSEPKSEPKHEPKPKHEHEPKNEHELEPQLLTDLKNEEAFLNQKIEKIKYSIESYKEDPLKLKLKEMEDNLIKVQEKIKIQKLDISSFEKYENLKKQLNKVDENLKELKDKSLIAGQTNLFNKSQGLNKKDEFKIREQRINLNHAVDSIRIKDLIKEEEKNKKEIEESLKVLLN